MLGEWERLCFRAWEVVQSCMRPAVGMGAVAWLGIDYSAAISLLQVYGLCYPSILDGVRIIENEALGVLNDASRKSK